MSKMLRVHQFGSINGLKLDEVKLPALKEDEVKIRVKATGITGDQLTFIRGNFHPGEPIPHLPATLGYEAAGLVEAVGKNVDQKWVGKRVAPVSPYNFLKYGSVGSEIIVPAERLVAIPSQLSFPEAAGLWIPYLTAYPLVEHGHELKKGDYVLITAATSTVGHAAIQYAQNLDLIPIGTTRSGAKAKKLKEITGIKDVIVTKKENLVKRVDEITNGKGISLIFDPIGGKTVTDLANIAAPGTSIIEYGVIAGMRAPLPVPQLLGKGLSIQGFAVDQISASPSKRKAAAHYILQGVKEGKFKPLLAAQFSLTDYQAAYRQLMANDKLGRVVLTIK